MAKYLRPRRGSHSNATAQDIILKSGEMFFEVPENSSVIGRSAGRIIIGDGATAYSNLKYASTVASDFKPFITDPSLYTPIFNNSTYSASSASWSYKTATSSIDKIGNGTGLVNLPTIISAVKEVLCIHEDSSEQLYQDVQDLSTQSGGGGGTNYSYPVARMKNLGTISNTTDADNFVNDHGIVSGTFTDIEVGDIFTIQDGTYNKEWIVAGIDWVYRQYYGITDGPQSGPESHHICAIPYNGALMSTVMNASMTYYSNTSMHLNTLPTVATNLSSVLSSHLLTRRVLVGGGLSTSGNSMAGSGMTGYTSSWTAITTKACLMSELELTGRSAISSSFYDQGDSLGQLPLFVMAPYPYWYPSYTPATFFWLRSVASSSLFAFAYNDGIVADSSASNSYEVRPLIFIG